MPEPYKLVAFVAVLLWYGAWGSVAFVAYARDKRAALRSRPRTPEAKLRGLELLGGAFGAAIAQRIFRHKTTKPGYRAFTVFIAALHAAILFGLGWWVFAP